MQSKAIITSDTVGAYCFINDNGIIYDLNTLRVNDKDYNRTFSNNDLLAVNMCGKANKNCANKTALATYTSANNQCLTLSGDQNTFIQYRISFDNITNSSSLKAFLPPGETCKTNSTAKYTIAYNLVCNKNQTSPVFDASSFDINKCYNEITLTSKDACPQYDVYGLWKAIMDNKYIFGSLILVFGAIFAFFGNKFILFTQIMTGVIATLFFTLYFIMSNIHFSLQTWHFWVIIGFCVVLGIIAGYFMSQLEWIIPVFLASMVGFIGGEFLYTIALKYVQTNPTLVYWLLIVSCVIVGALIGYWLSEGIIIVATSIIGAYGVMRGVAFMVGYFPDEKQIYELMNRKEWDQVSHLFTWHVYVYFVFFSIVTLLGLYVQCKYFSHSHEEKKKNEENKEHLLTTNPPQK
jgi:hypothetical protein